MNRNKNYSKKHENGRKNPKYGKGRRPSSRDDEKRYNGDDAKLNAEGRDNDPNWYFTDAMLADQVTQLSFQNIEGLPITQPFTNVNWDHCTIAMRYLNPCPGVQHSEFSTRRNLAAINQAGFKMFSLLSAYTGRSAIYGPQDISTMILALGEVISITEYIRRVFGCMFLWSERNRNFPSRIITAMGVEYPDLVDNYSDYRTKFNSIVQRINQIPIPRNIAYFDKCASLYEKVYMDTDSPMATLMFDLPYTTWVLDETSYSGGTILKTRRFCGSGDSLSHSYYKMSYYLNTLAELVGALLNSSTLNVVYTDLLNLATKMKVEFWKFDYLSEAYSVQPEYNENFLLQWHNCTVIDDVPSIVTDRTAISSDILATPYNDVFPDPANNALLFNPVFSRTLDNYALVDAIKPNPTVVDRIEMLRYTSGGGSYKEITSGVWGYTDFTFPDHYVVQIRNMEPTDATPTSPLYNFRSVCLSAADLTTCATFSNVDWMPIARRYNEITNVPVHHIEPEGSMLGDTNFYTFVDTDYLAKIIDFVGIALYSLR